MASLPTNDICAASRLADHLSGRQASLTDLRRALHACPELGYKEVQTASTIAEQLRAIGVDEIHQGIAGTGIVGVLRGEEGDGPVVGLRAELDALAMEEANEFSWRSKRPGVMHACGHDGHMAALVGAMDYLAKHRQFSGKICAIFQPAEEGGAGAKAMIDEGLLERFALSSVYSIHNAPWVPFGEVVANAGPMMAAADRLEILVEGAGGHGGIPHKGTDAILAAAAVIQSVQSIVSRNIDPLDAAVISFGGISAGSMEQYNVLPGCVRIIGTVRTFRPEIQDLIEDLLHRTAANTASAFGAKASVKFTRRYPATVNAREKAQIVLGVAESLFGSQRTHTDLPPSTAGEDFAFMLQAVPGAYIWLGQGNGEQPESLHSPRYDFDDRLIVPAAALFVRLAEKELEARRA
ncbi:amidohydrolase [Bradyrhizobium sp. CB82]|uniref:amidohydrolase n=1 Tax=Bradyrhizobium sp. CB82 TaxID=3039159 RepID=UPI0024B05CC9|nr:amidohydrolase [Bradyrhizobium sp. CB82]WFU42033.1 amidohydrolase [Bradyrhizobium sp. CB82]